MNELRIQDLEDRKKEANQNITRLEKYCKGKDFCNSVHERVLIQKNKQVIINLDGLINKLGKN